MGLRSWSMKDGQYEDLDGAAVRVLLDDAEDSPIEP
ncbi:cbb3-type cytochrome oxidase assembly protein CcoS [Pseudorhizobium flavum]|nr:cbb3-type cytochrome oxidase assembly protein CcoS [Pseudorhizobium flavum]